MTDNKARNVLLVGGSVIGLIILARRVEAAMVGNIVASVPLIYGQCADGACLQNTEVIAFVDFKNTGGAYIENMVGINVNGVIVKEMPVGLNPGTGFTMSYTFNVNPGANNICGVVR